MSVYLQLVYEGAASSLNTYLKIYYTWCQKGNSHFTVTLIQVNYKSFTCIIDEVICN